MTDQTAPKPIVTRAAEATANAWTFATELVKSPITQTIASLVIAAVLGAFGHAGYQTYSGAAKAPLPVALPDLPKPVPTPIASVSAVHDVLGFHCGKIEGKLDTLLQRTEPKGLLRKTAGKK